MTDPTPEAQPSDAELEQRLARLQARRGGAVSQSQPQPDAVAPAGRPSGSGRRAVGTKIGTVGASATAVFGLMALYGVAEQRRNQNSVQTDQSNQIQPVTQAETVEQVAVLPVTEATVSVAEISTTIAPAAAPIVVVVDADGNVLAAPDDLDPGVLAQAVTEHQKERAQPIGTATASTLAPVQKPASVDLAIPEPPPPAPRRVTRKSSSSSSSSSSRSGGGSSGGGSAPAPAPAPAPQPQSKSSGS